MAEMAGRLASLERTIAKETTEKAPDTVGQGVIQSNKTIPRGNESTSPEDLLVHKGSSSQYFNEILVTRMMGEEKNIQAALAASHTEHASMSPSPFHVMGILSSPYLSQQPSMFHPEKSVAIELWNAYLNTVEICIGSKLTHTPTDEVKLYSTIDNPIDARSDDLAFCFSIYFAATVSLEEPNNQPLLQPSKNAQLRLYKTGLEQAFAHGDFINRPTLTGLRALAIYLSAIRVQNRGRATWILNGLAIRIAQSLGLHRDGEQLGLSPFESELRRRLWWHIITKDSRAGEDYGLDSPTALTSTSEVNLPLNIDDTDLSPDMEELPQARSGWTSMTFSLIIIDLAKLTEELAMAASSSRPSENRRRNIILKARSQIERRLEKCSPVTPQQRLTVHCSHFLLQKLDFFTTQQWQSLQRQSSGDMLATEETLIGALDILEPRTFGQDPFLAQFSWAKKLYPQYHVTLYILWHLCVRPDGPSVDRAWRAIDSIFAQEMINDPPCDIDTKVVVLVALKAKAEAVRKKMDLRGVETQDDRSIAVSTEFQAVAPFLPTEGLNF
ncbi:hypothetical protein FSARC_8870, partial [Fusarium sarcochroum]